MSRPDHLVDRLDGECIEDCPACHFPGNACPVAADCDICNPGALDEDGGTRRAEEAS